MLEGIPDTGKLVALIHRSYLTLKLLQHLLRCIDILFPRFLGLLLQSMQDVDSIGKFRYVVGGEHGGVSSAAVFLDRPEALFKLIA